MSDGNTRTIVLIAIMAAVTALIRFLPFLIFGARKTPEFIEYLGKVLPYSVMGMLLVYCMKDISFETTSGYLPCFLGIAATAIVHIWKKNTIYSILAGTVLYMVLLRI